jgi:glycosyltransferase involved in cell wall biosynthesis
MGGGEKVIEALIQIYPDADIFTIFSSSKPLPLNINPKKVHVSALGRLAGFLHLKDTFLLGLYPWAIEQIDLRPYNVVISSCGPAVMGVNVNQDALHICYFHTPQRIWWDQYAEYQAERSWVSRQFYVVIAGFIRMWEFNAVQRVDLVVSNSAYIANRVFKYFRRESLIIFPPVNTTRGYVSSEHDEYYLSISRLHRSKRIDLLILACNKLQRPLVIVGDGTENQSLRALAGPTITFLGRVQDSELAELYARCRAFLFAADEDFGIAAVEAQSFGRPVIAYGHGGSLETVRVGDQSGRPDTGVHFASQTVEAVIGGIKTFEAKEASFTPSVIRDHANEFATSIFISKVQALVKAGMSNERVNGS